MTGTPDNSLPARSQEPNATEGLSIPDRHNPQNGSGSQQGLSIAESEFLRLLRFLQGEANFARVESSTSSSVALTAPAIGHEGLNTTTGSGHNMNSETRSRASAHLGPSGETRAASTSPRFFQGHDHVSANPPIDRVGRLEELNDVTGRELRSFRKSPCPPRGRRYDSE